MGGSRPRPLAAFHWSLYYWTYNCLQCSSSPVIISCGWNKLVRVWNLANCKLKTNHIGHTGYLNTVTVSPDGSLCASGGKDGQAMLWDLNEGKHLYTLDGGDIINALCFSPNRYWLCAATGPSIKIWDLEGKIIVDELKQEVISTSSKAEPPQCTSLAWSADGQVSIFDNSAQFSNLSPLLLLNILGIRLSA